MKRKSRTHRSYNNNKNKIHKGKSVASARYDKSVRQKGWIGRKKKISPYPYLITISYSKTNIFFTAADFEGHTKIWTNAGRCGFKNKDKTTYMAIVQVTAIFLKRAWTWGIRRTILIFRNCYRRHARFAIRFSLRKKRYRFKYAGFFVQNQMAFNGCRKKKKRRK